MDDYSNQFILWGIDGDWMVKTTKEGEKFYPTDHCGYIKVLDDNINPKYLSKMIENEGFNLRFSRSNRASIDRVSNIEVSLPSIKEQNEIVDKVVKIENNIIELNNQLEKLEQDKIEVVKSILELSYRYNF